MGRPPFLVPGSIELAQASAALMATYDAVLWAQHGLLCSGSDFDDAFGLMHTIEKSAEIYARARALTGKDGFCQTITDSNLRAIAASLHLPINESFLD